MIVFFKKIYQRRSGEKSKEINQDVPRVRLLAKLQLFWSTPRSLTHVWMFGAIMGNFF